MGKLLNTDETGNIARKLFVERYKKEDFPPNYLKKLSSSFDPYSVPKHHLIEFVFCLKDMTPFVLFAVLVNRESGDAQIIESKEISQLPKWENLDHNGFYLR
jgi:hypothetical protein